MSGTTHLYLLARILGKSSIYGGHRLMTAAKSCAEDLLCRAFAV